MHPKDGRVVSNFIMQALQIRTLLFMAMGVKRAVFALLMI